MTAITSVQPFVGPNPNLNPPQPRGECKRCAGDWARQHILDAFYEMTQSQSFPAEAISEFWRRYADSRDDMAEFAADRAEAAVTDGDWCEAHRPTPEDEE